MKLNLSHQLFITVYLSLFFLNNLLCSTAELERSEVADKPRLMKRKLTRRQRSTLPPPDLHLPVKTDSALPPPYLHLPVYVESREPLLDPEHFSPAAGTGLEPLPGPVQELLRPGNPDSSPPPHTEPQPEASVRVDCKHHSLFVEVDRAVLGSSDPERALRLGTCTATKSSTDYVYFEYKLTKCGTKQTTLQDQVVFSNTLHYDPGTNHSPIRRTAPFSLPLSCHFNRYQYSYKIGYTPKLRIRNLFKRMRNREKFTLTPRNALWEPLSPSDAFTLGRPMFFEAQAGFMSPGQRLYVHSCFATPEPSHASKPQFPVVKNYGCMVESKEGRSSFLPHRDNTVRFSVDAFIFQGFEGNQLYMHCTMSLGSSSPTATDKSCNYDPRTRRWVELQGSDSVCSCCDSNCGSAASTETVISSGAWNFEVTPTAPVRKKSLKSLEEAKRESQTVSPVRAFRPEQTEEGESVPGAVRWAVAKVKPQQVTGSAVVEEEVEEEDEEGTHRIFEEIFNLELYNLPESEIND